MDGPYLTYKSVKCCEREFSTFVELIEFYYEKIREQNKGTHPSHLEGLFKRF